MTLTKRDEVTNAGLGVYRETPLQLPYSDNDQQQQLLQQHSDAGLAMPAAQFGRGVSAGHTGTNANTNASSSSSSATGGAATLDPTTAASLLQQLALRRAQSSSPPKTV
jgi:hypothetical protein